MHLLLTRPEEDAAPLAAELESLGHTVTLAPMMRIEFAADAAYDLDGVQAIVLTSANGARALARATAMRDLPVLAVGAATAAAARAAGFQAVDSADGDVVALAALARDRCRPDEGDLLHVSGHDVAGDLAGLLQADGFTVRRAVLYRALAVERLQPAVAQALAAGSLDGVVLFSPRTATIFCRLLRAEKLDAACRNLDIYALSKAVAAAAATLPWRGCHVAARPTQADLVNLLRQGASMSDKDDKRPDAPWGAPDAGGEASVDGVPADAGAPLEAEAVDAASDDDGIDVDARDAGAGETAETIDAEALDADAGETVTRESAAPRRSRFGVVLVVLLLLVVVGGAAVVYLAGPQLAGQFGLPVAGLDRIEADQAALRQRLGLLESAAGDQAAQLAALNEQVEQLQAATGAPGADVGDLAPRLAALEDVVQALSDGGVKLPPEVKADIATLTARVVALSEAQQAAGSGDVSPQVMQRLDALAARIDAAAETPPRVPAETAAALRTAESELAEARQQIAALTQQNDDLTARLAALGQRIEVLERQAAAPGGDRNEALVLAVGQLRDAVSAGRPFAAAVDAVAALAGDNAALASPLGDLRARSDRGVATLDELRRRFPTMAGAVMRAGDADGAGIVDRTLNRLSSLVVVRRTGEVVGDEPDAVLARAEQRLAAGDVAAAVGELDALSGPRAEAAADWLAAARDRLAAQAAVAALHDHAIKTVAGG